MAWKGLSRFKSGTKFIFLEPQMRAAPSHKHCIKNFSGVRYKKTLVFLDFGLAVFISWNQRSPIKPCIHATVKFTDMKGDDTTVEFGPKRIFLLPNTVARKIQPWSMQGQNHTPVHLWCKQCDAGNTAGWPCGSICCLEGKMYPSN